MQDYFADMKRFAKSFYSRFAYVVKRFYKSFADKTICKIVLLGLQK